MTTTVPQPTVQRAVHTRPVPSRRAGDITLVGAALIAGITAGITAPALAGTTWSAPGALAGGLGIVTAMGGTLAALFSIVLMARLPWIEHQVGQDRLTAWHRNLGPWALLLIVFHVVFTVMSYAQKSNVSWGAEFLDMSFGWSWMLPAVAATIIMVGLGLMSMRSIRRRMKYETWHIAHLYFYLAVALAFGHQIEGGAVFSGRPWATAWWVALYVALVLSILAFRVGAPLLQSWRHDLRVAAVVPVDHETVHVYVQGRDVLRLGAQGGQWMSWRFGTRNWWWQGHPYSLSAAPTSDGLRLTVKNLGDQSGSLTTLTPGTRVFVEGPYGAFRADRRHTNHLVLVGAGVGITPIRALLDEIPPHVSADVIYRSRSPRAPLADELIRIAEHSGGRIRLHLQAGSRRDFPMDARALLHASPGIAQGDVYACGPTEFLDDLRDACSDLGLPPERFHHELFEF